MQPERRQRASDELYVLAEPGSRDGPLIAAFLRRWGLGQAILASDLPRQGVLVVPSTLMAGRGPEVAQWAQESADRLAICEPSADAGPLVKAWPRLVLSQKRSMPRRLPTGDLALVDDAEYLADLVEVAWTGLETRLAYGRGLNATVVGYLFMAAQMLASRCDDPQAVVRRAEPFAAFIEQGHERTQRFAMAAWQWLLGNKSSEPLPYWNGHILNRLQGRRSRQPPDGEDELIHQAHLVAADNNKRAWRKILSYLDVERGLFRRSKNEVDGQWQFHPVLMCAVARRLPQYVAAQPEPVHYPAMPCGAGPMAGTEQWWRREGNVWHLQGSLLSDAARRLDPPSLDYPYAFSEWTDLTEAEQPLVELLREALPPSSERHSPRLVDDGFLLSVRHDVDRPLTVADLEAHIELEDRLGCRSTWYFKRETFDPELAEQLRASGREVAYHAERLSTGDSRFVEQLHEWLGQPPGLTFHGGLGSEFFRGRQSLEDALRWQVRYAEVPVGCHPYPSRWYHVGRWLPVAPMAVKFDMYPERSQSHADLIIRHGGLVIVENHPDYCSAEYGEFLARLCDRSPRHATVAEALDLALPGLPAAQQSTLL